MILILFLLTDFECERDTFLHHRLCRSRTLLMTETDTISNLFTTLPLSFHILETPLFSQN